MKNITRKELIGVEVKISDSKNKKNIGIEGKIIDETKKTLTIETEKGMKKIIKDQVTIELKKERVRISGNLLVARPEDRIKKRL